MNDKGRDKSKRTYRPAVEALEALRLLATAALPATLPPIETEFRPTDDASERTTSLDLNLDHEIDLAAVSDEAWDVALNRSRVADLLDLSESASVDASAAEAGLNQLNRYLSRAWYRAGISPQNHDDCTQAVYISLLETYGRDRFDRLASEIDRRGIQRILTRETKEGPDFFRAVDAVKKRMSRVKNHQTLDGIDAADDRSREEDDRKEALYEAIVRSLTPREAALVRATLDGETPAEIADKWGVAPKTVSNEKTRVIHKLRLLLLADCPN